MAKEDNQGRVKLNPISISQLSSLIFGKGAADPEIIGQKGDPDLEYLTEGNIPISEAEMKTREIRKKFGDKKDEIDLLIQKNNAEYSVEKDFLSWIPIFLEIQLIF